MTEVYTLRSESGDEYKLQFTTDRSGIIADNLLDQLNTQGIEVVEIIDVTQLPFNGCRPPKRRRV